MLVKFTSSTSGEMIMFAHHARELFEIIGKECTQRGVFVLEQLPEAITLLQGAVDQEKLTEKLARMSKSDKLKVEEVPDNIIAMGRRALPLIQFMELTLQEKGFILWETERDF